MSRRAVLVLSAVALLLLGYVVLFERDSITSKEREGRAGRVLVSFVRDKVSELAVQRNGSEVVLKRAPSAEGAPSEFRVSSPYRAEADADVVDHLLGELEWLSARRTLENTSEGDRRAFGLLAPRVRVRFEVSGERHTLALGNADVHGDGIYVQLDHAPRAYVVPKTLLEVVDHEPGDYRAKQLFPELTTRWVQKLERSDDGTTRTFVKREGRFWTDDTPAVYANEARIDELLRALSELRAARFPAKPPPFAATQRFVLMMVPDQAREDAAEKAFVLELAGPCAGHAGERWVRSGTQADALIGSCVSEAQLAPLAWSEALMHEPHLFVSEPAEVSRIVLTRGARSLSVAREGTTWKGTTEASGPVDGAAVEGWLDALHQAQADAYAPLGNFVEHTVLSLERVDGRHERVAAGNLTSDDAVWVRRDQEPLIARYAGSVFDRLQPSAGRFQPLELWPGHQPSEIVGVEARAGELARTLELRNGGWGSNAGQVDSTRVRVVLRQLLDQRAHSLVSAEARAAHGFDVKSPRVELRRASGAPWTLELGAASDHGGLARVDGARVVEVGSEVAALVRELAGGPTAPTPALPPPDAEDEDDEEEPGHAH